MKFNFFTLALLLFAGPWFLRAQAPDNKSGLNFRTLGWGVSADDLFVKIKGKLQPIMVTDTARSPFYPHDKTDKIVIYRMLPGPDKEPVPTPIAQANITTAGEWPLLIFLPATTGSPSPYRIVALADDIRSFPASAYRFINLTDMELKIALGDQSHTLKGEGIHQFNLNMKNSTEAETRYVSVSLNTPKPEILYGNNWAVRPGQRTLVIIFKQNGVMQINRVNDNVAAYTLEAQAAAP
jgi:hypothetical protein